jgi:hypothetical protein
MLPATRSLDTDVPDAFAALIAAGPSQMAVDPTARNAIARVTRDT